MAGNISELRKSGWILSEEGFKIVAQNNDDSRKIIKRCLDIDLREIGAGVSDLSKGDLKNIESDVVVQILKIRNISAPKANESSKTAPKLLKLQLTDGKNAFSAIEMESTPLSLETKPGTKILLKIKYLKIASGQLLLTPKNVEILGGYVEQLVSKWEVSKTLAKFSKGNRIAGTGGPPPFIPFGQKIQQAPVVDKGFKSLQTVQSKENANDNAEFNALRKDAIAEAAKVATKKTFGGGSKQLVDTNVQKVLDQGYSEEQATYSLKLSRNNPERALMFLKRREERSQKEKSGDYDPSEHPRERRGGKREAEPQSAKPPGNVSLFDFLEGKIPAIETPTASSYNNRFENNMSTSFRKFDKDPPFEKSSNQWSTYSSGPDQKSSQNYKNNSNNTRDNHRDSRNYGETKSAGHKGYKDSHDNRDARNNGDTRSSVPKGYKDSVDTREPRGYVDSRNTGPKGYRDSPDSREFPGDSRNYGESKRGGREPKGYGATRKVGLDNIRDFPDTLESTTKTEARRGGPKGYKDSPDSKEVKDTRDSKYNTNKDTRESRENRESKYNNTFQNQISSNNNSKSVPTSTSQYQKTSSYPKSVRNPSYDNNGNASSNYNSTKPKTTNSSSAVLSKYNSNNDETFKTKNVVDSMDKLSLKSKVEDVKSNATTFPTATDSKQNLKSNYLTNSFVGFQNKEANEHAKNVLKTKNIAPASQKPTYQQKNQATSGPAISQALKNQPPPFKSHTPMSSSQTQMHSLPQPFVQHQNNPVPVMHSMPPVMSVNNSQAYLSMNYQAQPVMQPTISNSRFHGKVGEMVMAKYWEDGQFYSAKITAVSESTYVILFTEYGNAEEVRKADCLPYIQAPAVPITQVMPNYTGNQPMHGHVNGNGGGSGGGGSYRTQKMPSQHNNYHQQQQQQQQQSHQAQTMPYKNQQSTNKMR